MPDNYFARYLPLLIHFVLAGALASALVTLSWIIGHRKPTRAKLSPYECGMTPIGDSAPAADFENCSACSYCAKAT